MPQIRVRDIRAFKPALAAEVAERLELQRGRVMSATQLALRARFAARSWTGPAAEAAAAQQVRALVELADVAARIATCAAVVRGLAGRLESSLELLRHAERVAWDRGAWTDEDGTVHVPQRPPTGDATLDAHIQRLDDLMRVEVQRCLAQAVALAGETDAQVHRQLFGAVRDRVAPTATGELGLVPPPPEGALGHPVGAFANAAWWRSLTFAERGQVLRTHPEWVGPRDGIPARDRHAANLVLLARARVAATEALRRAGPLARKLDVVATERVESIAAIDAVLAKRDGIIRHLLLVDITTPVVRAVTTVGDIDRAGHVATFVGGLSTSPHVDLRRYDERFVRMRTVAWTKATGTGEEGDVAIAIWMGYPAPQVRDGALGDRSAIRRQLAVAYADDLASFTNGIAAARDIQPHQALWAHSYGSVVVGEALQHLMRMDEVALFGSPGTSLDSLAEGGLKPGSLNVLAAPTDPITYTGWHGRDPRDVAGVADLAATCALKPGSTNEFLKGSFGHSQYLEADTTSEYNLAAIAADRPDLRIPRGARCPLLTLPGRP
jgi:hypothetical protein